MDAEKKLTNGQMNNVYRFNGTAAYKVKDYLNYDNTAPKYEPEAPVTEVPQQEKSNKTDKKTAANTKQGIKPRAEQNINLGSMIILVAAIVVALYTCIGYLQVKADIIVANKKISSLESQLEKLQTRNEASYNEVIQSVDFDAVYQVAVAELGMVFPNKNTTIKYAADESGYVRQYSDIPEMDKLAALKALLP